MENSLQHYITKTSTRSNRQKIIICSETDETEEIQNPQMLEHKDNNFSFSDNNRVNTSEA